MKHSRRILAALVAIFMLSSMMALYTSAAGPAITITNPYDGVNWATYGQYRTQLHTHTTASDGSGTLAEVVEAYYAAGYHALAITDHNVVDRGWINPNSQPFEFFFARIGAFFQNLFSEEEVTTRQLQGITQERYRQVNDGHGRGGAPGMIRVPFGIEHGGGDDMGGLVHVNSFFADWGNGFPGGLHCFMVPVRGVTRMGSLSMINHPTLAYGNRDKSLEEVYSDRNDLLLNKEQRLFEDEEYNSSLIGIELHNRTHDRKFWDILLTNLSPTGRNVFGVFTDDSHNATTAVDRRWVVALMPELTYGDLFNSLEAGAFFGARRYNSDIGPLLPGMAPQEMDEYREGLVVQSTAIPEPKVTNITAANGVISIEAQNVDVITWISDGEIIHQGASIDLAANLDKIGAYVRVEIWGARVDNAAGVGQGVVLYTQPFLLNYTGRPAARLVPDTFSDPDGDFNAFIRTLYYPLFWVLDRLWEAVRPFIGY